MSDYGTLYSKPPMHLVDGVVRESTILDFGYQIETGFEAVGNLIGNMHGLGFNTVPASRFTNSIASSLGDISKISQEEPFGVRFNSYIQNFSNDNNRKDFILDLVPVPSGVSSIAIVAPDDDGVIWTHKSSLEELQSHGDFNISGRVITFYQAPINLFSVTYDGTYPEFTSDSSGFRPNVYPSPNLIESGSILRPTLSRRNSGRIRVEISESNINSNGKTFGANLELEFSPLIKPYVNAIGATKCPHELVSAWIKDGDNYRRIHTSGVYILDKDTFEIDTDETIDELMDTIVICMSNVTIADMIRDMYSFLISHSHDKEDVTSPISHGSLINLIPVSDKQDVIYGGSNIPGNDHPEYLHREGYRLGDPGSYNNALLGDLLIGSTDSTSLFNNVLADSNKLIFGSTTEGASVKYRSEERDLYLFSPENGLSIDTKVGIGKQSKALVLNGHEFYDYSGHLTLTSGGGVVRITEADGETWADLSLGELNANAVNSLVLDIQNGGSISIGNINISDNNAGSVILNGSNFAITAPTILTNFSGSYNVDDSSAISFGDSDTTLKTTDGNKATFESTKPLTLASTGKNTGIGSDDSSKEYFNLYSASPNGSNATPSDHDTYFEAGEGGIYSLMSTRSDQVEDGEVFSWQNTEVGKTRIDNLKKWPRAPFHAGHSSFKSITLNTSSIQERRGVSFGELNHIYVTGSGTACPSGWMVFESQNGAVFVDSRSDAIDCQSLSYSSLTSGDIQSFGSVIAELDVSSGGSLRANEKVIAKNAEIADTLTVEGESRFLGDITMEQFVVHLGDTQFNTNVEVKGSATIANNLVVGNLRSTGIATFEEIAKFQSSVNVEKDLTVEGELRITDRVSVTGKITVDEITSGPISSTSISSSEAIIANGGVESRGDINVNGNISTSNILTVQTNAIINDTVFTEKLSATGNITGSRNIDIEGEANIRGDVTIGANGGKLTSLGETVLSGDSTSISGRLDMYGDSSFYGDMSVNSAAEFESVVDIKGSTTIGSDLKVSGTITTTDGGPLIVDGLATFNTGIISGALSQLKDIISDGNITASGDIEGGIIKANGGFQAPLDTSSSFFDATIAGGFTQSNPNTVVTFAGVTSFTQEVEIEGDTTLGGELIVGSESNGVTVSGNHISIAGDTAQLETKNAEIGRIYGNLASNEVTIPDTILQNVPSLVSAFGSRRYIEFDNAYFKASSIFANTAYFGQPIYVTEIRRLDESSGQDWIDITSRRAYYAE